ncbi:MAG: alpha/beta hydrolase [Synergistota bacterium]|nr:alpha/beta hydrolase [Synergistota bacterium]
MSDASLIDHPVISGRYFFPRTANFPNPFYVGTPGGKLACHYTRNHPEALTVVHFHGNGEIVCDWMDGFVSVLDSIGFNVLLAEFRGYGMSGGSPSFGAVLDDTPRIFEAAELEPSRTVLFGRSVGSIPAIHGVSLYPGMAGLVLESGIADVMERLLVRLDCCELGTTRRELEQAVGERMDHKSAMNGYKGPVLVLHAQNDSLVDISHGRRLFDWAGGERKKLHVFEKGDHNTVLFANMGDYFAELGGFLKTIP